MDIVLVQARVNVCSVTPAMAWGKESLGGKGGPEGGGGGVGAIESTVGRLGGFTHWLKRQAGLGSQLSHRMKVGEVQVIPDVPNHYVI